MLHPLIVHFAISLPIISLVAGLIYLITRNENLSKISTIFMFLSAIFLILAYFTGKHDATDVFMLLSSEGKSLLRQHKDYGLYIAISISIIAFLKAFGSFKKSFIIEVISILSLIVTSGALVYQGSTGGNLTYKYGANVQKHSDGMDCLNDPEDFIEDEDEDEEDEDEDEESK